MTNYLIVAKMQLPSETLRDIIYSMNHMERRRKCLLSRIFFLLTEPFLIWEHLDNVCAINNRYYMIYGSTLSFLIPFVIMAVTLVKTTHLLNKQASQLSQRADNFHNGLRRTMMHRKLGYARTNSYSLTHPNHSNGHLYGNSSGGSHVHRNSVVSTFSTHNSFSNVSAVLNRPHHTMVLRNGAEACLQQSSLLAKSNKHTQLSGFSSGEHATTAALTTSKHNLCRGNVNNKWRGEQQGEYFPPLLARSKFHRRSMALSNHFGKLRTQTTTVLMTITGRRVAGSNLATNQLELANEHKATRVLAVVFFCFFLCWTPFFLFNFTLGFCGEKCGVPSWASSLFLWLGYFSSTLNPIIYTIFNKRFRQAFLKILRCQCVRMHPFNHLRYSTYSRTHTFVGDAPSWSMMEKNYARESFNNYSSRSTLALAKKRMLRRSGNRALSIAFPGNNNESLLRQEMAAFQRRTSLNTRRRESKLSMTGHSLRPQTKDFKSESNSQVFNSAAQESSLTFSHCKELTHQRQDPKKNYLELRVQSFLDSRRSSEMCRLRRMLEPVDNSLLSRSVSAAILSVGATNPLTTNSNHVNQEDYTLSEKNEQMRRRSEQLVEMSVNVINSLGQTLKDHQSEGGESQIVNINEEKTSGECLNTVLAPESQHENRCLSRIEYRIFSIGHKFTSKETTI